MTFSINNRELVPFAKGEKEADLVLKNGRIINVFTGEILSGDVAVAGEHIAAVGSGYKGKEEIDLKGRFVCPGFIDGHIHIESTMLTPFQFTRAVLPHGTTAVICDPHEIANVLGMRGIQYMLDASEDLPVTVFVMAPSCVPATPLESSGACLDAHDLAGLYDHPRVLGLAEMMNFPGVLCNDKGVMEKLREARLRNLPIDGHCPGLGGMGLQAYVAAGIDSDHECTTKEEALEKLRAGMYLMIREDGMARNLKDLIPAVTDANSRRCMLVSDDRHPEELIAHGHMDYSLRLTIEEGIDPVTAIRMVTLNTAEKFGLSDRGAVAAGYRADIAILKSLDKMDVEMVFSRGRLAAKNGVMLETDHSDVAAPPSSVRIDWKSVNLSVPALGTLIRVIGIIPGQIMTKSLTLPIKAVNGFVAPDPERDILKLAVIERHRASGSMSVGFVSGIGLKRGAMAGTVAHDSHNLVIAGENDNDMMCAARAVAEMGGGLAAAIDGTVIGRMPLPVAGLMSADPIEIVCDQMEELLSSVRELGCGLEKPFMQLSFLALPVIPSLKLTDKGLVDVDAFKIISLFAG